MHYINGFVVAVTDDQRDTYVRYAGEGARVFKEVRRYLMSRTQHWLYFRVKGNILEVLSVWSTSREGGPKV